MAPKPPVDFQSDLDAAEHRLLSRALQQAHADEWRTPEDFVKHFSPRELMQGLSANQTLRAKLLVEAAGVHEKIAFKKSLDSAAEDLQIALDEAITTPAQVLELLPPDDRVRYLEHSRVWRFVFEGEFFKASIGDERAVSRMLFLTEVALDEGLITLQDFADGVGVDVVAKQLPLEKLQEVVAHALAGSRHSKPLTEESLLEIVPLAELMKHLPLDRVWEQVLIAKVAAPAGFTDAATSGAAATGASSAASQVGSKSSGAKPEAEESEPKPESATKQEGKKQEAKTPASKPGAKKPETAKKASKPPSATEASKPRAEVPPPPPSPAEFKSTSSAVSDSGVDAPDSTSVEVDDDELFEEAEEADDELATREAEELGEAERSPQEQEARQEVIEKLRAIERLPPGHPQLSTPILLSIESMCAELLAADNDEAREECIRDSFPNETHMRTALLSLIELLDPSIDVTDPLIRDAEIDSLIKVVLFEERHRYEQQRRDSGASSPKSQRSLSVPPPLPRPGAADGKRR